MKRLMSAAPALCCKDLNGTRHATAHMPEGGMFVMVDIRKTGLSGDDFAMRPPR